MCKNWNYKAIININVLTCDQDGIRFPKELREHAQS